MLIVISMTPQDYQEPVKEARIGNCRLQQLQNVKVSSGESYLYCGV